MLSPKYLEKVADPLEELFNDAITDILKDIAERIYLNKKAMTSTAQYQIMKLEQLGLEREYIQKRLQEMLQVSDKEIEQIMTDSAYESIRKDMAVYKKADIDLSNKSFDFSSQILKGTKALKGDIQNLCNTTFN